MNKILITICISSIFMSMFLLSNNKVIASTDMQQPAVTPNTLGGPYQHVLDREFIKEYGDYTYSVISERDKTISIRTIKNYGEKLVIPEKVNGYKVVGLTQTSHLEAAMTGTVFSSGNEVWGYYYLFEEGDKSKIKEVVLPEGIKFIGEGAFKDCVNLRKINLPESLTLIAEHAFNYCVSLKNIVIPKNAIVEEAAFYNMGCLDSVIMKSGERFDSDMPIFVRTSLKKYVLANDDTNYLYGNTDINKVISGETVKELFFYYLESDKKNSIAKMYVQGKNTTIDTSEYEKEDVKFCIIKELYTVKNAKCISTAKKYKIPYTYKESKPVKVKNNKWKKVKTTTVTSKYSKSKKKWDVTKKTSASIYKVYAKNKKAAKYKLVETTKKNHTKKKYKYVKVKVDLGWE